MNETDDFLLYSNLNSLLPKLQENTKKIKFTNEELKILTDHLGKFQSENYNEIIVSLLREYKKNFIAQALINEFYSTGIKGAYSWSIAEALYTINKPAFIEDYNKIISDKAYGKSRQMIAMLLGRIRHESSVSILLSKMWERDYDVLPHAIYAIGKYKKPKLNAEVERFAHDFFTEQNLDMCRLELENLKETNEDYEYLDIAGYLSLIRKEVNKIV